jgi:hypothetical protein
LQGSLLTHLPHLRRRPTSHAISAQSPLIFDKLERGGVCEQSCMNRKEHWEGVYTAKADDQVSWTQAEPRISRSLIAASCPPPSLFRRCSHQLGRPPLITQLPKRGAAD